MDCKKNETILGQIEIYVIYLHDDYAGESTKYARRKDASQTKKMDGGADSLGPYRRLDE